MSDVSIIAGPASSELANKISNRMNAHLIIPELRVFSDGESKIRMQKPKQRCIIVQSTYPPVDTHLVQLMMIAEKCREFSADDICAVIPYLAYARQDRAFLEGEVVSIALIAKLLRTVNVNNVISIDMHSQSAMSHFASIDNISSIPLLADYAINKIKLNQPLVVSPDAGGIERAKEFATHLKAEMISLRKSRDRTTGEVTVDEKLDTSVSNRDIILIDDMISSGGSIIKAAEVLVRNGAATVYAMCAHGLLLGDAAQKIKKAGVSDIIATNSVPSEYARVDLSTTIANTLILRYSSA